MSSSLVPVLCFVLAAYQVNFAFTCELPACNEESVGLIEYVDGILNAIRGKDSRVLDAILSISIRFADTDPKDGAISKKEAEDLWNKQGFTHRDGKIYAQYAKEVLCQEDFETSWGEISADDSLTKEDGKDILEAALAGNKEKLKVLLSYGFYLLDMNSNGCLEGFEKRMFERILQHYM